MIEGSARRILVLSLALLMLPQYGNAGKAQDRLAQCTTPNFTRYGVDALCKANHACSEAVKLGLSGVELAEAQYHQGRFFDLWADGYCLCCQQAVPWVLKDIAQDWYRKALAGTPAFMPAREAIFHALLSKKLHAQALEFARESISVARRTGEAHSQLGAVLFRLERWDDSAEAYGRAALAFSEPAPKCRAYESRGMALEIAGELSLAIEAYEFAALALPGAPSPRAKLGRLFEEVGRYEEAKVRFNEALRIDPKYFTYENTDRERAAHERVVLGKQRPPIAAATAPSTVLLGTGFFVSEGGLFITNAHVVEGANRILVGIQGGQLEASVIRIDSANDLAVLKVAGRFVPLPLAGSSTSLGAEVFTVGFPNPSVQGTEPKLTNGTISSLSGIRDDPRYFQINVELQPGNSGGPLVDRRGNVVGVVTASLRADVALRTAGALPQNVNYAMKSLYVVALLEGIPGAILPKPGTREYASLSDAAIIVQKAAGIVRATR